MNIKKKGEKMEGLTTYLTNLGSIMTQLITWFGSVITIFTDNPVLFVFLGAAVFGLVLSMVRSLIRGA